MPPPANGSACQLSTIINIRARFVTPTKAVFPHNSSIKSQRWPEKPPGTKLLHVIGT